MFGFSKEPRCSAYIFPAVETFRLTFLRMRDICKIMNVQRKPLSKVICRKLTRGKQVLRHILIASVNHVTLMRHNP